MPVVTKRAIYLAGKITDTTWREDIVCGLKEVTEDFEHDLSSNKPWGVIPNAIFGRFAYCGPYYTHRPKIPVHGLRSEHGQQDESVASRCLEAIDFADLVFAWLDQDGLYGTAVEIGYAKGRGKLVYVARPDVDGPRGLGGHGAHWDSGETWFVSAVADSPGTGAEPVGTPSNALHMVLSELGWLCESEIECAFWSAVNRSGYYPFMRCQYAIGPYRADVAAPEYRLVIELDGHDWHKTKEQRTHDAKRDRYLTENGWQVIRFTGSEVYRDADACVEQAVRVLKQRIALSNPVAQDLEGVPF